MSLRGDFTMLYEVCIGKIKIFWLIILMSVMKLNEKSVMFR